MGHLHLYRWRLSFALLAVPLLLSSCSTYRRAAAPDDFPAGSASKRGQKPYTINGTRYEPLSSHDGFEQSGIASSYGSDFHGRTTSSGESFDMHAMTAAHKTLPLGVYVRVVHQRSGKSIVVRINDRGPFVRDRIIDLSEGAADKLGILQDGLAPVRITALGYKSEGQNQIVTYRAPGNYDSGFFTLQVGAFAVKSNAYRYADTLRSSYGAADVQEAVVKGTTYFRVRVGRYTSLAAAQTAQEQYGSKVFPGCFVVAVD
jgi:rare lipoprotein A